MSQDYERVPISEVIRADENNHGHWFEAGAKRFFRSRWDDYAYKQDGFYFWISSERMNAETPRRYTIRFACCECMSIYDIDGFQAFGTKREAVNRLKYILARHPSKEMENYHHWKLELKHVPCASEQKGGT